MNRAALAQSSVDQAIDQARFYGPIEDARAVYRGLVIVGHRESAKAGEMFWALPGCALADTVTLKSRDPAFQVLTQPAAELLLDRQARIGEVTQ